jgi:transposase
VAKPILTVVAHDPLPALRLAVKKTSDAAWKQRLKAVLKAREGTKRRDIAEALVVSERSVGSWIKAYNCGGVDALKTKPSGRKIGPQLWDSSIFTDLCKEIDKGGYWSIPKMQEWIEAHHHKAIPEQTVWYRMDQLSYSYKGARPHPAQGNKDTQEAFKKGALLRSWSR